MTSICFSISQVPFEKGLKGVTLKGKNLLPVGE